MLSRRIFVLVCVSPVEVANSESGTSDAINEKDAVSESNLKFTCFRPVLPANHKDEFRKLTLRDFHFAFGGNFCLP
jgi:hypothetical protein